MPNHEPGERVRYGFVIDQGKCIGCHACTVACKEENRVPLGAFRTWVKYVERGTFPDTRRYFAVLRCNHCDDAPCVTICPTVALYRRPDGIVDFDGARCIGCKSCMQACPYDALYIDPDTNTAAKCNYCAHRVEVGLEPACVIVCPVQAIVAGDLDDPRTPIARLVGREQVQVRKPEQGTRPKVFYLGADASTLAPALQQPAQSYMWASRPAAELDLVTMVAALQAPGEAALSRPVYDVPHAPRPWGGRVSAYLWTKAVSAGALLVGAAGWISGQSAGGRLSGIVAPLIALVFLALTTVLLVADLKRPDRFHYILLKPNWRSWLVRGAWILMAHGAVAVAWLVAGAGGSRGLLDVLAVPAVLLAAAAAGYSALLFGQAEGRDFWQSPLLLVHLLVAAVVAGAASLLLAQAVIGGGVGSAPLGLVLGVALIADAVVKLAELYGSHANVDVARAAALVTRGRFARRFWWGAVTLGLEAPVALLLAGALTGLTVYGALGALCALAGLW
ncbi:MAG: polysulfide reductase NrfD, partial [Candidatus Rokubacteria bacterium]|nr:polysulfide reductase NrfD [Candidatus Rokubacteria bacterium]